MQRSESIAELAKALAAAQGEFTPVKKNRVNPHFGSKYADLDNVMRMAAPILGKHGIAVMQLPSYDEAGNEILVTTIMHSSGEWVQERMYLHLKDAQAHGSALTYAKRYSYGGGVGVATDDDDDGSQATDKKASQGVPAARATRERPAEVDEGTGEVVGEEDMEARRQRVIAEAKAKAMGPLVEQAQAVAEKQKQLQLATRTRPSPRRPMP
jgi:hypothetical protein